MENARETRLRRLTKAVPSMGRHSLFVAFLTPLILHASPSVDAQSRAQDQETPQGKAGADTQVPLFRDCDFCPEMAMIPGGSFLMGSPDEEVGRYSSEGPQHEVSLPAFALGRFEVTRGEFAHFVQETGHATGPCVYWNVGFGDVRRGYDLDLHNPSHRQRQTDEHPMTCVSWDDAQAYVDWLRRKTGRAYRLPSESEWEYAARSGTRSRYFWGDEVSLACDHANGHDETSKQTNAFNWTSLPCSDGFSSTAPVGSQKANGFSLFDMAGNLWEWVEDHYHQTYDGAPADGTPWLSPGRSTRVLRGGSWENEPRALRSASRIWSRQASRLNSNGFRVALTLSDDSG
ncbi:MAG: formylglycine-generating enzyme family protein [Pseudomonadota bacterium]